MRSPAHHICHKSLSPNRYTMCPPRSDNQRRTSDLSLRVGHIVNPGLLETPVTDVTASAQAARAHPALAWRRRPVAPTLKHLFDTLPHLVPGRFPVHAGHEQFVVVGVDMADGRGDGQPYRIWI